VRKEDYMIGIYAIRNMINDKMYIGKSDDIIKRWKSHQKELREGHHRNSRLQSDWNLHGEAAFRFIILEEYVIPDEVLVNDIYLQMVLFCREYFNMKKYDSLEKGYNIENTLSEILRPTCEETKQKYIRYQYIGAKTFYRDNKEKLLSPLFNINQFCELVIVTDPREDPSKLSYIFYGDEFQYDARIQEYEHITGKIHKNKKKKSGPRTKNPNLFLRKNVISHLDESFRNHYRDDIIYYIEVKNGYFNREVKDNGYGKYVLSQKGIDSGYYVEGSYENGYNSGIILLTPLGAEHYKDIASNIEQYIDPNIMYEDSAGYLCVDWSKVVI
jgi:group I intron endonuclease